MIWVAVLAVLFVVALVLSAFVVGVALQRLAEWKHDKSRERRTEPWAEMRERVCR